MTAGDGREFKLTPEALTIERKTFKQSSTSRRNGGGVFVWVHLRKSSQSVSSHRTSSSPRLVWAAFCIRCWSTVFGAGKRILNAGYVKFHLVAGRLDCDTSTCFLPGAVAPSCRGADQSADRAAQRTGGIRAAGSGSLCVLFYFYSYTISGELMN